MNTTELIERVVKVARSRDPKGDWTFQENVSMFTDAREKTWRQEKPCPYKSELVTFFIFEEDDRHVVYCVPVAAEDQEKRPVTYTRYVVGPETKLSKKEMTLPLFEKNLVEDLLAHFGSSAAEDEDEEDDEDEDDEDDISLIDMARIELQSCVEDLENLKKLEGLVVAMDVSAARGAAQRLAEKAVANFKDAVEADLADLEGDEPRNERAEVSPTTPNGATSVSPEV